MHHEANKLILFAQIRDPYEVTPYEFAQTKDVLFEQRELLHTDPKLEQI